jgi:hypothetical protein
METKKSSILKYIKKADIYGVDLTFRVNGKWHHKSFFGGISSIFVISFCLIYIIQNLHSFAQRHNMSLIYTNKILDSNPKIDFTETQFNIALSLSNGNSKNQDDVHKNYDFSMLLTQWIGEDNYNTLDIPLIYCTYQDFPQIKENLFYMNNINKMLCPDKTKLLNFTVAGLYSDYWYQYIEIQIKIKNYTEEKLVEVENSMYNDPMSLEIFFTDTGMNYDNITHPLSKYLNSYYTSIAFKNTKISKLFYSNFEFKSDENIFVSNSYSIYECMLDRIEEYTIELPERNFDKKLNLDLVKIFINASQKYFIVSRIYQKFPDLLANITGILSQVLFLFMLILSFSNKHSALKKIVSKVLKFEGTKSFDINYLREVFKKPVSLQEEKSEGKYDKHNNLNCSSNEKRQNYLESKILNLSPNESQRSHTINFPKIENYSSVSIKHDLSSKRERNKEHKLNLIESNGELKNTIIELNKSPNSKSLNTPETDLHLKQLKRRGLFLKLKTLDVLKLKLNCCTKNHVKSDVEKILSIGKEKMFFYLDILTYIRKMQELDILKYLLLSGDHLNLFRFLSKPLISSNDISCSVYKDFLLEQKKFLTLDKDDIDVIRESYSKIYQNYEKCSVDEKLINLVDAEIESLMFQ